MAQRHPVRFIGALAALAFILPLAGAAGCNLLNKEKKQFGEDCQSDTDCDSQECATYGSICTKSCVYDKECGAGLVCRARDGRPGDVCSKPTGVPNGGNCNNAAECQSGNCLKPVGQSDATGFCSTHCETDAECPETHKRCVSISDSGAVKFCIPSPSGDAEIPGSAETPKFVAPRPTATAPTTTSTSTNVVATTSAEPTTSSTTGNLLGLGRPTASASASSAPTTSAAATTTATTTPSTRPTTTIKRPIIKLPKK